MQSLAESCIVSGSISASASGSGSKLLPPRSLAQSTMGSLVWGDSLLANDEVPSFVSMDSHILHTSTSTASASVSVSASPSSVLLPQQELTERAVTVVQRVLDKLTGRDFPSAASSGNSSSNKPLAISDQIDRLINEATSNDNLSTCYMGWCPLW